MDSSNTTPDEIASSPTEPPAGGSVDLPLAAVFARSAEVAHALDSALGLRIAQCMGAAGFDFAAPSLEPARRESEAEVLARRYSAPVRRDSDGVYGYAFDGGASQIRDEIEVPVTGPSADAYYRALNGSDVTVHPLEGVGGGQAGEVAIGDSCIGDAIVTLFGSADEYAAFSQAMLIAEAIGSDSLSRLYSDQRVLDASQDWLECMRSSGFDSGPSGSFRSPLDVTNQDWPSPRPSAVEQAVARADASCREMTPVAIEIARVDATIQAQAFEQYPDILSQLDVWFDHLIELAN